MVACLCSPEWRSKTVASYVTFSFLKQVILHVFLKQLYMPRNASPMINMVQCDLMPESGILIVKNISNISSNEKCFAFSYSSQFLILVTLNLVIFQFPFSHLLRKVVWTKTLSIPSKFKPERNSATFRQNYSVNSTFVNLNSKLLTTFITKSFFTFKWKIKEFISRFSPIKFWKMPRHFYQN